jgi:hypothetical protein
MWEKLMKRIFGVFKCPICGKRYRSYWDGNDILGWGTDICGNCYTKIDDGKLNRADYPADLDAHKRISGRPCTAVGPDFFDDYNDSPLEVEKNVIP